MVPSIHQRSRTLHSRIHPSPVTPQGATPGAGTLEAGTLGEHIRPVSIHHQERRIRDRLSGHNLCRIRGTRTSSTPGSVWEPAWGPDWRLEQQL